VVALSLFVEIILTQSIIPIRVITLGAVNSLQYN